jgi:hypothetical protein
LAKEMDANLRISQELKRKEKTAYHFYIISVMKEVADAGIPPIYRMKVIGERWMKMSFEQKQPFVVMAERYNKCIANEFTKDGWQTRIGEICFRANEYAMTVSNQPTDRTEF